jgi:RimJ/RimL family protein N-acetyltransferase
MVTADAVPPLTDGDVSLRPPQPDDAEHLSHWGADPEFARYQWASDPWPEPQALAARFLERFAAMPSGQGQLLIIEAASVGGPIGYVNYRDVRAKVRSCEAGIAIGDRAHWSQGFGVRALRLLLGQLFGPLGMHKVSVRVVAFNTLTIRTCEKCGFRREGLLRDAYWFENRWWDSLLMAMLEDEWRALQGARAGE